MRTCSEGGNSSLWLETQIHHRVLTQCMGNPVATETMKMTRNGCNGRMHVWEMTHNPNAIKQTHRQSLSSYKKVAKTFKGKCHWFLLSNKVSKEISGSIWQSVFCYIQCWCSLSSCQKPINCQACEDCRSF